jgi:AraC-like DNA-binding protein
MDKLGVRFTTISIDNIPGDKPEMAVKNLIVSRSKEEDFPEMPFSHPHIVDGAAFLICTKGEGRISLNLKEYVLKERTVMCILPGFIIESHSANVDFTIEYLFFSLDFYSELRMFPSPELPYIIEQNPCMELDEAKFSVLLDYYALIIKRYPEKQLAMHDKIIRNLLRALLYEAISLYDNLPTEKSTNHGRNDEITLQFSQLLSQNCLKEREVTFYANRLFITPKHLSKVVKKVLGRKPLDLINEMVMLHIQALLKSSNLTIAQIAEELHFSSPSFLGRFFKKYKGMTPMEYRNAK